MNPWHLLHLECQRFWPNRTFRILAVLYVIFVGLISYASHLIIHHMILRMNGASFNPAAAMLLYPKNWELLAYLGSWINATLLGFLGVFMTTQEFSQKTLRQGIIFGLTRQDIIRTKLVAAGSLALAATAAYVLLGLAGELLSPGDDVAGFHLPPASGVFFFFLQTLAYLLLATLAGLLIRQTALATLVYLAYVLFLESTVRWIFFYAVTRTEILMFLPNQVFEGLTPVPWPPIVRHAVQSTQLLAAPSPEQILLATVGYLFLFTALIHRTLEKADL